MPAPTDMKKPGIHPALGLIALLAIVIGILLFNTTLPDKGVIAGMLQQFAGYVSGSAAAAGTKAELTYKPPVVDGFAYDKFITLPDIRLDLPQGYALSVARMSVVLDPLNSKRYIFRFVDPVIFSAGQQSWAARFPDALKIGYMDQPDLRVVTVRVPGGMTLTAQGAKTPLDISHEEMAEFTLKQFKDTQIQEQKLDVRGIVAKMGDEKKFTVGALSYHFNETPSKEKGMEGSYILTVSDLNIHQTGKAALTYSITSNISYSADQSLMNPFGWPVKAKADAVINKLLLSCDDFGVKAEGNFSQAPDDGLPSGSVVITIDNVQKLLASDIVPQPLRDELKAALPAITGKKLEELQGITVPVKRVKGGAFTIGLIGAGESGITMITDRIKKAQIPAQPVNLIPSAESAKP